MKIRKSTLKLKMAQQIKNSKNNENKPFHQEILKCPLYNQGCNSVFIGNAALIVHLETECNHFISKASQNFKVKYEETSFKELQKLTKFMINTVKSTPILETWDKKFVPMKMQTNYSVQTKKPDRFPRLTVFKKIEVVKEIEDMENLELGSVPMKSNLACSFSVNKNKIHKCYIAYRLNSSFSIYVKEIITGYFTKKLEGHKDHISEIKYLKNDREEGILYSSSFDNTIIIWSTENFIPLFVLDFKSWVLSTSIVYLKRQNCALAISVGGYYKKYPVKVFNMINGNIEYEIKVTENISSEICNTYVDEETLKYYLFVGSDNCDKPRIVWYDFKEKTQLGTFPATSNVTSINVDFCNKSLSILYSDSAGVIRQGDLSNGKVLIDFRSNNPVLDLLIWDNEYFITCGNPRDNSIKIYTRTKTRLIKSFENVHSRVICNISKNFLPHNGNCLITVGGDRKVKVQKLV